MPRIGRHRGQLCVTDCNLLRLSSSSTLDETLFSYAKTLSPAAIDLELRTLVSLDHLRLFMHALTRRLRSRRDFEAVQTFQHVFLRMHSDVIIANDELSEALQELKAAQEQESVRVLELITSGLGVLSFVRDTS